MNRKFAIFAAVIASLAITAQSAEAGQRRHVDKRVTAVAVGVGAASTAAFFAINDWRWNPWDNSSGLSRAGAWGVTTFGCAVVSPMVASAVLHRPLKYREAHVLIGSCVIPVVGGWLVNEAYNARLITAPDEEPVVIKRKRRHGKHHAMHH